LFDSGRILGFFDSGRILGFQDFKETKEAKGGLGIKTVV
jgi:hypothetical protein